MSGRRQAQQRNEARIWRASFPFLAHHAEQMNLGIENPQRTHEIVSPDGSPMSFRFQDYPPGRDTDMPDYVPSPEIAPHEQVAPVYQDEPVPGRAVLQGYEAPNERVQYLLSDLSRRAIQAVSEEIDALPLNHQPPNFDFNSVLNVPGPHLEGGNGLISPPPLLGYGVTQAVPISKRPARRVLDLDIPHSPLPARKKRTDDYDKFVAAQRILEPPPPTPERFHGSDDDDDEFDISAPVEDPAGDDQLTQTELPFTLSLDGVEKLENNRKWPVPTCVPRNDLGYSYLLLNKVLKRLKELNTRLPYTIKDFERVCTERQMERLKRWIHLPGTKWTEKEDIELFELVCLHGKTERAWLIIGSEMRMFYSMEAYNRYNLQCGYEALFRRRWTRDEDKLLFDLWADPQVRQRVYEEFIIEYPHRTRRSCMRRLERLYLAAIGKVELDTSMSEEPESYQDTESDDHKEVFGSGRAGPGPSSRGDKGGNRAGPSEQLRTTNKRNVRSPDIRNIASRRSPPTKKQRREEKKKTSAEGVRQVFQNTTQKQPLHQRPLTRSRVTRQRRPAARQVPFSKDELNLLWELRRWEYTKDTAEDWAHIARELQVHEEQPGSFVRAWYITLELNKKAEFPLAWTTHEDEVLRLWCQERPKKWKLIASKLPRRSAAGCQRRKYMLEQMYRSPTESGL